MLTMHKFFVADSSIFFFRSANFKGILKKTFAAKIHSQIERFGADIDRHNLHFRQEIEEDNEFNVFFTNSCAVNYRRQRLVTFYLPEKGMPTTPAVARVSEPAQPHYDS